MKIKKLVASAKNFDLGGLKNLYRMQRGHARGLISKASEVMVRCYVKS